MRRRTVLAVFGVALGASGCTRSTHAQRSDDARSPAALLDRAIEQAGGAGALARARALVWEGDATVHAGGRTVRIAGRWAVQPPDSAVVATYDVTRGPATTRSLVVAAPRGWLVSGDRFAPMPPAMLANERDEFYLYDVMRLVPLRDAGVALERIAPDSSGNPGLRARRAGRPDVELYVDARTGRLAHLRTRIPDAAAGKTSLQDVWLSGHIEASGVRWPRALRITLDGAPYFEMTLRALVVGERLSEAALAGPR